MTSLLFARRHILKVFIIKNLTKNSFNMQKILLLSLTNWFLDRGANLPLLPVQIGCKNSPVYIQGVHKVRVHFKCTLSAKCTRTLWTPCI